MTDQPVSQRHRSDTRVVVVRCPACEYEREIRAGDVPAGDYPMCPNDGLPLIVTEARA